MHQECEKNQRLPVSLLLGDGDSLNQRNGELTTPRITDGEIFRKSFSRRLTEATKQNAELAILLISDKGRWRFPISLITGNRFSSTNISGNSTQRSYSFNNSVRTLCLTDFYKKSKNCNAMFLLCTFNRDEG
jgi:hypothetical protein